MGSRAQRDVVAKIEMSLSFTHLGTGSRGNATLVESGDAKVLIDQGFSGKQLATGSQKDDSGNIYDGQDA